MTDAFLHRDCPSCRATAPVEEVSSRRRAEAMTLNQLRPYWSGFYKEKVFFSYHRCGDCGLLFAPTFFTGPQLGDLYSAMAPNMDVIASDAIEATQRGYFDAAVAGTPLDGGYLEIGPDVGHIAGHAARDGSFDHFWLVEPNRSVHASLAAACAGKPHDIITDMDDLSPVPDGSIGLAVMVHVLDHLLDPVATLAQIHGKLKPGGRVMIVTHNESSLLRSVVRRKWPPFCLQHPQLFNPASIGMLLGRAGYDAIAVERSKNVFPFDFMVRQAAWAAGIDLGKLPLPRTPISLKLGNMITVAHRPR